MKKEFEKERKEYEELKIICYVFSNVDVVCGSLGNDGNTDSSWEDDDAVIISGSF